MLIEVHIIQNHAPNNLNRDDSGSPKSAMFGGYRRARISSQCLKRCYRTSKTFRDEVDGLGMHTRSMPEEIKKRLIDYAAGLTDESKIKLKEKFEEWAEKCQAKLAAILGKDEKETSAVESEVEEGSETSVTEEEYDETSWEKEAEGYGGSTGKNEKHKMAQSIFWREAEFNALFDAYKERIEWDDFVPSEMRKAFKKKDKVDAKRIIEAAKKVDKGGLCKKIQLILEKIADDEKKCTKNMKKSEETAARALAHLTLEGFDPKVALKEAGLRHDGIPVDMALFGRMVAGSLMHNVEASSQFAHAIGTNEFAREFDLWTRVDDRRDKRLDIWFNAFDHGEKLEAGTDGMGDAEFTSDCFYNYFNVDFDALIDNLTGKALNRDWDDSKDKGKARERACNAVIGLIKAAIFERPTGKFNSMATPTLPTCVLVEIRDSHVPVSYVNAFAKPVDPRNEETQSDTGQVRHVDLPEEAARLLIKEANRITHAFNRKAKKRLIFTGGRQLNESLDQNDIAPVYSVDDVEALVNEIKTALACPDEEKQ